MAEALGFASSALQIASFGAELGSALWKYSVDFRNAGSDITAITTETTMVVKALESLHPLMSSTPDQPHAMHSVTLVQETREVLCGCRSVFNDLYAGVKYWTAKSQNGKLSLLARGQWPLRKQRLVVLQQTLSRYSQILSLMLTVVQFAEGRKLATREDLAQLQKQLEQVTEANKELSETNKMLSSTNQCLVQDLSSKSTISSDLHVVATPACRPSLTGDQETHLRRDLARMQGDPSWQRLLKCRDAVQALAKQLELAVISWQTNSEAVNRLTYSEDLERHWTDAQRHMELLGRWAAAPGSTSKAERRGCGSVEMPESACESADNCERRLRSVQEDLARTSQAWPEGNDSDFDLERSRRAVAQLLQRDSRDLRSLISDTNSCVAYSGPSDKFRKYSGHAGSARERLAGPKFRRAGTSQYYPPEPQNHVPHHGDAVHEDNTPIGDSDDRESLAAPLGQVVKTASVPRRKLQTGRKPSSDTLASEEAPSPEVPQLPDLEVGALELLRRWTNLEVVA